MIEKHSTALKIAIIAQTLVTCAEELAKIAEQLEKEKKT